MAMEDAVALSAALVAHPDLGEALAAYEAAARPSVEQIQGSARPSLAWWEHFGRYHDHFEPWQFAYHFLSRSITDARIARRAPDFVATSHERWVATHGAGPLETPLPVGPHTFPARLVAVSPDAAGPVPLHEHRLAAETAGSGTKTRPTGDHETWGARLAAPDDESGLGPVFEQLAGLAAAGAALVAVHGGSAFTRTLVCEEVRMRHGLPALLVDPGLDRDKAVTAVLSGRADLVGADAATVASW
jgi:anthraniloyl-CoA monooxygenase